MLISRYSFDMMVLKSKSGEITEKTGVKRERNEHTDIVLDCQTQLVNQ